MLAIFESKGLEFDDVLLYNLFTDSQPQVSIRMCILSRMYTNINCMKDSLAVIMNCGAKNLMINTSPSRKVDLLLLSQHQSNERSEVIKFWIGASLNMQASATRNLVKKMLI